MMIFTLQNKVLSPSRNGLLTLPRYEVLTFTGISSKICFHIELKVMINLGYYDSCVKIFDDPTVHVNHFHDDVMSRFSEEINNN